MKLLLPACSGALVLPMAAEASGFREALNPGENAEPDVPAGLGIAVVQTALVTSTVIIVRWSHRAAWTLAPQLEENPGHRYLAVLSMCFIFTAANAVSTPLLLGIGAGLGESISPEKALISAVIVEGVIFA